jgi:anaerobic selenocysteine-containing dehydrogenase
VGRPPSFFGEAMNRRDFVKRAAGIGLGLATGGEVTRPKAPIYVPAMMLPGESVLPRRVVSQWKPCCIPGARWDIMRRVLEIRGAPA